MPESIAARLAESRVEEYERIEHAFDAAIPWIAKGYVARITDKQGIVVSGGQFRATLAAGLDQWPRCVNGGQRA
jgi:hypothetical protein